MIFLGHDCFIADINLDKYDKQKFGMNMFDWLAKASFSPFDDTKIEKIKEDVAYLDYQKGGIDGIVDCLLEKLAKSLEEEL